VAAPPLDLPCYRLITCCREMFITDQLQVHVTQSDPKGQTKATDKEKRLV